MLLSIIIPTYNERETICSLIEDILQSTMPNIPIEILIIDDQSPDGTASLIQNKNYPSVRVISRQEKGLVSAIRTGINLARGTHIMWFDADLYMIPPCIPELYNKCLEGYAAVIASRYTKNGSDHRHFLRSYTSLAINKFAQYLLKLPFTDYTSGIILCNAARLKSIPFPSGKYGEYFIELLHTIYKQDWSCCEFGYTSQDRLKDKSKATSNPFLFCYFGINYLIRVLSIWAKS